MVKYIHSGDYVEQENNITPAAEGESNAETGAEEDNPGITPASDADQSVSTTEGAEPEPEAQADCGQQEQEAQVADQPAEQKPDARDPGVDAGVDAGASTGAAIDGDQDSETSAELGTEEKEESNKGFFAQLFGTDAEEDEQKEKVPAEPSVGDSKEAEPEADAQTADVGVDSGATGYGKQDIEPSDGLGTPEQEGAKNTEAAAPAEENSTDSTAGDGGQQQDAEASDELGAEEQESSGKGFFARLFGLGTDVDEDEDTEMPDPKAQAAGEAESAQPPKELKQAKEPAQDSSQENNKVDPLQKKRDSERSDSIEESITYWQGHDNIPPSLEDAKNTLTEVMGLGSSFDVVFREMSFGGHKAALLCISGFAKDTIMDEILKRLTYLTPENLSTDVFASFMNEYIPHIQVEKGQLLSECINKVMSGMSAIFIEGETQVIVMDTRTYPSRNPDEPSIERVVRGSRDGFTETLLSNVALVRRRIRDPGLKYEMHQVGRRTRTDVCVAYIDDIVDKTQVKAVTDKIKSVNVDGIPLADKQLEEAIVGGGWNPYPLVRYSERPDTVASHLLEGRVVVFVDTSPSVMVLPTTFFDLCQHAEENRQTPFMGTYLRWVRFIGIFASMFLLPLWMLLVIHPELKPAMLEFIGPQKTAKIPLLAQFLIVELGVDLLRMAAVHTPTPLGSAMGLIAAILVGDIAVQTGLFVNEVVLYMAVASIGMFATPSYELGLANRIVRLALLIAVAAFQVPGFMIGSTLLIVLLTTHRSYNSSYLWPFIPFNAKAMGEIILRQPVLYSKTRPSFNKTRDNTRMPPIQENEKQS